MTRTHFDIDPVEYVWDHGTNPRGRGSWAFSENRDANGGDPDILWSPSMTYRDACTWAKAQARARELERDNPRDRVVLYTLP